MREFGGPALQVFCLVAWWTAKTSAVVVAMMMWVLLMLCWIAITVLMFNRLPRPIGRYF